MKDITIGHIAHFLEDLAPLSLQENYDNSGLLVGNNNTICTGILVSLDCTEAVIDEAIANGCNMVVAHHPIVFGGLKKLTGRNYVERTVIKAIKNDVAIYAIHTNLDNVSAGVNRKIGQVLGLENLQILSPKKGLLKKLVTFVPQAHAAAVRSALFDAGAGHIGNYSSCSFNAAGQGTFKAGQGANPFVGQQGELHTEDELRVETVFPDYIESKVLAALQAAHPYEEVAYDVYLLDNAHAGVGSGMVGTLPHPVDEMTFLQQLKTAFNCGVIKYTKPLGNKVSRVAVCGGSGRFLLNDAIRAKADVFITSDFKYHDFFDADNRIVVADIGHYESEQYTSQLLHGLLIEKFTTFAVCISKSGTNPINYL